MTRIDETASNTPAPGVFPTPGSNIYRVLFDAEFRRTFHARLKIFNPMVVAFYRLGLLALFGADRAIMLITTKGRKSGAARTAPIGFFRIGGAIHIFSAWGKKTGWYQNLIAHPDDISLQVGRRELAVRAQVLEDPAEIQRTLEQFVAESPQQAQSLFGWRPGQDRIEQADFSAIINKALIVRFTEKK